MSDVSQPWNFHFFCRLPYHTAHAASQRRSAADGIKSTGWHKVYILLQGMDATHGIKAVEGTDAEELVPCIDSQAKIRSVARRGFFLLLAGSNAHKLPRAMGNRERSMVEEGQSEESESSMLPTRHALLHTYASRRSSSQKDRRTKHGDARYTTHDIVLAGIPCRRSARGQPR